MAKYLVHDQQRGSIKKGKFADLFLRVGDPIKDLKTIKSIALVVIDRVFSSLSAVCPTSGIKPFAAAPRLELPTTATD